MMLSDAFNGLWISKTTIPPFIVTLAMMNIGRGAGYVYTGGQPIRVMSDSFNFIGSGYIFDIIPMPVIYLVLIVLISSYIMNRTKLGRHIYAVGGNPMAALFSGIKNGHVKFFAYVFSGTMSGISGIVLASRMFSGQPTAGQSFEMDAIAAVVRGVCCASRLKPSKIAVQTIFTLQTPKARRLIGIFALLLMQKSTNVTGCWVGPVCQAALAR
jgi:ribose transport system permease protein